MRRSMKVRQSRETTRDRKRPEIRKKSGIRNGLANSVTACMKPVAPTAFSTPSVECIITTKTMQIALAASTQSTREEALLMIEVPSGRNGSFFLKEVDQFGAAVG